MVSLKTIPREKVFNIILKNSPWYSSTGIKRTLSQRHWWDLCTGTLQQEKNFAFAGVDQGELLGSKAIIFFGLKNCETDSWKKFMCLALNFIVMPTFMQKQLCLTYSWARPECRCNASHGISNGQWGPQSSSLLTQSSAIWRHTRNNCDYPWRPTKDVVKSSPTQEHTLWPCK